MNEYAAKSKKRLSQGWSAARDDILNKIGDDETCGEAERMLKNWERLLKCEQMARSLLCDQDEIVTIDVQIEGL